MRRQIESLRRLCEEPPRDIEKRDALASTTDREDSK
jgi:hypothetical protein